MIICAQRLHCDSSIAHHTSFSGNRKAIIAKHLLQAGHALARQEVVTGHNINDGASRENANRPIKWCTYAPSTRCPNPRHRRNATLPLQKRLPAPVRGPERTQPSCRVWTRRPSKSQHRHLAALLRGRPCQHWFSLLQRRKNDQLRIRTKSRQIPDRTVLALREPPPPSPLAGGFFFK